MGMAIISTMFPSNFPRVVNYVFKQYNKTFKTVSTLSQSDFFLFRLKM